MQRLATEQIEMLQFHGVFGDEQKKKRRTTRKAGEVEEIILYYQRQDIDNVPIMKKLL